MGRRYNNILFKGKQMQPKLFSELKSSSVFKIRQNFFTRSVEENLMKFLNFEITLPNITTSTSTKSKMNKFFILINMYSFGLYRKITLFFLSHFSKIQFHLLSVHHFCISLYDIILTRYCKSFRKYRQWPRSKKAQQNQVTRVITNEEFIFHGLRTAIYELAFHPIKLLGATQN